MAQGRTDHQQTFLKRIQVSHSMTSFEPTLKLTVVAERRYPGSYWDCPNVFWSPPHPEPPPEFAFKLEVDAEPRIPDERSPKMDPLVGTLSVLWLWNICRWRICWLHVASSRLKAGCGKRRAEKALCVCSLPFLRKFLSRSSVLVLRLVVLCPRASKREARARFALSLGGIPSLLSDETPNHLRVAFSPYTCPPEPMATTTCLARTRRHRLDGVYLAVIVCMNLLTFRSSLHRSLASQSRFLFLSMSSSYVSRSFKRETWSGFRAQYLWLSVFSEL